MGVGDATRLQTLHNVCLRVCLKCERLKPKCELYEESHIHPLHIDRIVSSCGLVYAGLNQMSSKFVNSAYVKVSSIHCQSARACADDKLVVPAHKLECSRGNILTRGAYYYTDVPINIHTLPTLKRFKQNLKVHLVSEM